MRDSFLNRAPLLLREYERQRVESPRAVRALRIGIDVIGNAVLDDQAPREFQRTARRIVRLVEAQTLQESQPMRAHCAVAIQKLVVAALVRIVGGEGYIAARAGHQDSFFGHHFALHEQRRSSVKGRSGFTSAGRSE